MNANRGADLTPIYVVLIPVLALLLSDWFLPARFLLAGFIVMALAGSVLLLWGPTPAHQEQPVHHPDQG